LRHGLFAHDLVHELAQRRDVIVLRHTRDHVVAACLGHLYVVKRQRVFRESIPAAWNTKFISADASPTGAVWQGLFDKKLRKINNLSSRLKYLDLNLRGVKLLRVKGKGG
jgi:hypothetical protein